MLGVMVELHVLLLAKAMLMSSSVASGMCWNITSNLADGFCGGSGANSGKTLPAVALDASSASIDIIRGSFSSTILRVVGDGLLQGGLMFSDTAVDN